MSTIEIRDLPESIELDRNAMKAVRGGMSFTGRATPNDPARWILEDPVRLYAGDPVSPIRSTLGLMP
jgi:hypothetical protein